VIVRIGVFLLALAAALVPAAAGADPPTLQGNVGPAFVITLNDPSGNPVTHLDAGTYAVHVTDQSTFHNFHLAGPGVDQATTVEGTGTSDWLVTLSEGTYTFVCDAHPAVMKGSFTVGTPTPPPPPPPVQALKGRVGPGLKIAFAHSATAGKAKITIRDLTAKDNFHLVGPGVNKRTGIAFKGTATWTVRLRAGKYTFRSDAHKALRGTLTVS
jgi:plastocyanin